MSAMSETAVERIVALDIEEVEKRFVVPHERMSTLKQRVLNPRRGGRDIFNALKGVSLDVERGEFFGIVGRNGSGKSTLLKCIAGIYVPDSGSIRVRGKLSAFIELGVGFDIEMTARDNVILNATLLGLTPAEADARFDEIIAFAELEEFVDLKLKNYSSGMQVRLAFAVAVHVSADVFLIDEVLAVGDAAFQQKCLDTFEQMRASGRTIVLVTHDMGMVEKLCDRAALINDGELICVDEPAKVAREYMKLNFERTSASSLGDEGDFDRWGDGTAEVEDCWFEDDAGQRVEQSPQGDWLTVCARIRFAVAMEKPIVGIVITDDTGTPVFATNTDWDHVVRRSYSAGEEVMFRVRFQNHLEGGQYHASPAVAHASGLQMADWRQNVANVFVAAERRTPGRVVLPHDTTLERVAQ